MEYEIDETEGQVQDRLRAHVARLEAEKALKDAALDNYIKLKVGGDLACYWHTFGQETPYAEYLEILHQEDLAFATLHAALSDHAGEAQARQRCPECGEERPNDDRVAAGMKCGSCAYGQAPQGEGD